MPTHCGRSAGSAFYIHGDRLLTNAHVVRDYTTVRVRRHGGSEKYKAKVLCINHACDLAILSVDEPGFWTGEEHLILLFGHCPSFYSSVHSVEEY